MSQRKFAAVVGALLVALIFYATVGTETQSVKNSSENVLQDDVTHSKKSLLAVDEKALYDSKVAAFLAKKLSKDEEQKVMEALMPLNSVLNESEVKRSELVKITKHPETDFVVLKTAQPSNEDIQKASEVLTGILAKLDKGSKIYNVVRANGTQAIQDYTAFPKPFKFIQVVFFNDPQKKPRFGEAFMDREEYGQLDLNGSMVINWGRDKYRGDDNYGVENSWSTKRYSHLSKLWAEQ